MEKGARSSVSDDHLANRLRFSLRVSLYSIILPMKSLISACSSIPNLLSLHTEQAYLSILYLRVPENFCMVLRGSLVEYHNIANELKYRQCIMYRPQSAGVSEVETYFALY